MPLDIPGQHTQKNVCAHPVRNLIPARAGLNINSIEDAEPLSDVSQCLVSPNGIRSICGC